MVWEYVFITILIPIVVIMVIFRKNPIIKKYWKYSLALIPLSVLVTMSLIKGRFAQFTGDFSDSGLRDKIDDLKDSLQEASLETAVEISAAKEKNKEIIEKLKEIKKIPKKKDRIRRLADLIG